MSDTPVIGGSSYALEIGLDLSLTIGTALTPNASADTKGTWVELITAAANTEQSNNLWVCMFDPAAGAQDTAFLVDIGVGGAGVEEVICPNLFGWISGVDGKAADVYNFPIDIPAGARIAARNQASIGSEISNIHIIRSRSGGMQSAGMGSVIAYGEDIGVTGGVLCVAGDANAFGVWTEITSSTTERIKGFVVACFRNAGSWSSAPLTYQVGVGGAGVEETIFSGQPVLASNSEFAVSAISSFIPVEVAGGTRLAIRAQSSSADADLDFDYIIYGVR